MRRYKNGNKKRWEENNQKERSQEEDRLQEVWKEAVE
jgi:hypothetical protein